MSRNHYCLRARLNLLCLENRTAPAAGALDPTFGTGGLVTTEPPNAQGAAVAVDQLGRTLVAGSAGAIIMVARYRPSGLLDSSFGGTGIVTLSFSPGGGGIWNGEAITVDSTGRIVVVGKAVPPQPGLIDFAVARFLDNGALDPTFNGNGKQLVDFGGEEYAESVAIDSQGRIVLAGYTVDGSGYRVARLTANGALDSSFGVGGKQIIDFGAAVQEAYAVAVDSLDRVVVAGFAGMAHPYSFAVARLTDAGFLDPTFDGDGRQTVDFNAQVVWAWDVAIDSQNRIVVAGDIINGTNGDFAVARLTVDGALDANFDGDGKLTLSFDVSQERALGIAVDSLGRIVVAGFATLLPSNKRVFAVARVTTTGGLDTSFDGDGKKTIDFGAFGDIANDVAIAPGDRVVLAGDSQRISAIHRFAVAKLTGDTTTASGVIQNGAIQRSRVTTVTVRFSSLVTFSAKPEQAFTLVRTGGGAVNFTATVTSQFGGTIVTLSNFSGSETEFGSLRDGRYTLTALASQITAGGQPLDGDADGTPGGNFVFGDFDGLYRFFGDINGDRRVDVADYGQFSVSYLNAANFVAAFDFNGDGRIDIADYGQFAVRYLAMLP